MIRKMLLTLSLVVLLVHAADDVGWFNLFDTTGWISLASIIIIIHLLLVSLAYMVSYMLEDEEMKAWCRNEVMQAVFSAIIVASLVGVLMLLEGATTQFFVGIINPQMSCSGPNCHSLRTDLTYDPSTNRWEQGGNGLKVSVTDDGKVVCTGPGSENCDPQFLMARSYLGITYEKLAGLLKNLMFDYATYYSVDSFGLSASTYALNQVFGLSYGSSFPLHSILLNTLDNMITFTEKQMMLIKFQESILKFFEFGMASGLIVLGVLLRSIWIFRKAGGLFLAMGIAFMYLLPLMYNLGWYTIDIKPMREIGISKAIPGAEGEDGIPGGDGDFFSKIAEFLNTLGGNQSNLGSSLAILFAVIGFIGLRVVEDINPATAGGGILKTAMDVVVIISAAMAIANLGNTHIQTADDLFTDYETGSIGYFDMISRYLIVAIALPLINFYIVFSFIRGLSPMLGGDVEIPALGRLL